VFGDERGDRSQLGFAGLSVEGVDLVTHVDGFDRDVAPLGVHGGSGREALAAEADFG